MASSFEATVDDEIRDTRMGSPHVVLLGAGASRAAFPNGDVNGHVLPLMADFVDHVPIGSILGATGFGDVENFEVAYGSIAAGATLGDARKEINQAVYEYFSNLALPDRPTLYDHLILSLRPKDVIATFNWDPFLYQAARRNIILKGQVPAILFLHGNVLAGYCQDDDIHGYKGTLCSKCRRPFQDGPLLYPIGDKDYRQHPMIAKAWDHLERSLQKCFMFTIFGYSAPSSDEGAISLLKAAWGGFEKRNMEQVEFINTESEDKLLGKWKDFVHTHHYDYHADFYESWIANHPRRTGEAYWNQYLDAKFISNNPLPREAGFEDLWAWFMPLLEHEAKTE